jgi:hypothetical protein
MGISRGCALLELRLDELLERAGAVRESVSRVRDAAPEFDAPVDASFQVAAHYVAGTLSDVTERLRQLDEVLVSLER